MSEHVQTVCVRAPSQAIKVAVAELKPHPLEAGKSTTNPSRELLALAERMKLHGQPLPIEILPDFTVVSDHESVRAARLLKWNELDAIVRADLPDKGEVVIEEHVLISRLDRPGRHKLEVARDLKRLHEIGESDRRACRRQDEDYHPCQLGDLRTLLAETLDAKGRTLNRWLAVLAAPVAVQDALIRGEINLVTAEAAGRPQVREKIAQAVEAGSSVKEAIDAHGPKNQGKHKFADDAVLLLARDLERAANDLKGREHEVKWLPKSTIEALQEGCALLQRLAAQVEEIEPGPGYRRYRSLRSVVFRPNVTKVASDG